MIKIFYTTYLDNISNFLIQSYLSKLPVTIQSRILKYRTKASLLHSLLAKILLKIMIKDLGYDDKTLEEIKYNRYNKPYIENGPNFNISHSGNVVVLAVDFKGKIGVDTEKMQNINLEQFKLFFTNDEWDQIESQNVPEEHFYKLWTKKEAILKLLGCGLNIDLNQVKISGNFGFYDSQKLFLKELFLSTNNITHIATDRPICDDEIVVDYVAL